MKNLPSNRGSRDSLAREHICQSSVICRTHHNCSGVAGWTFSDHALEGLQRQADLRTTRASTGGSEVRKRPVTGEQSPQTSNLAPEENLSCLKQSPSAPGHFPARSQHPALYIARLTDTVYARSPATLRRMPGMLHSILDRFQSVSKRFVSLVFCDRIFRTIQIVLFLSTTASLQPLELERSENLLCLE